MTGTLGDGTSRNYSTGITYSDWGSLSQEQFGTDTAVYNKLFYSSRGQLSEIRDSTTPNDTSWNRGAIINHYSDQCWGMCSGSSMTDNNGNLKNQDIYIPNNDQVSSYVTWRDHFDYDSLNRLQRVHEYADGTHDWQQEYTYDQWGNRRVHQTNTWGYNIPKPDFGLDPANNNRLSAPAGYTMSYDAAGNLTNDTYTGQGQRIYDAENRMTQAWANGQWQVYSYDGDGRRVKRRVSGQETWQVYGIGGELVAEYDANAAPSSAPLKEYGYRNGQLLVTAEPVNLALGKTATQSSTFSGMAASRAVDGNTDGAIWDGYASVTDYNTNGWWQVDLGSVESIGAVQVWGRTDCCPEMTSNFYVFVSDNPFTSTDLNTTLNQAGVSNYYVSGYSGTPGTINANRTGRYVRVQFSAAQYLVLGEVKVLRNTADVNWLVTDQLGTPRMIFDKTGSLANTKRHDYLPFGEELFANQGLRTGTMGYSASDSVRQKFSQKERDNETGLDYFGARYYGSMMGRFTGADSLLGSLTNPQTLNRYAYVGNDPLNFTDPTGHARFDVPSKFENGGELRLNPYEDAIAWQNVEYTVAAADAAAANASEPEPEAAAYAGDGIVSAGETDADETNQQPQNTATEPFVVSNPAALESGIVAGQIAYRDSNDVAQCARLPLEWQINQENFEISRANRGRRLTANWVMGPEITYGMDLAYGTVLATFIRETGIYGNGEPHTGSHTVVFFRWETRNGELGMVVGQQMAGRHGSAERGFIPFKADNPYYANAYRFNVVLIPRALRRFTMADKE